MSMEKDYIIHETHSRSITAIGSSLARREIYLGYEDGIIKSVEIDTGKHVQTYEEHKGWITSFLYWPMPKLLFSASNDSIVSVIGPGSNVLDKVFIGTPVYSMSLNYRRKEIIFGVTNGLQFHKIYENKTNNHYIDVKANFSIYEHTDIVRCVLSSDSRIYSAGYDGALVIYDCHYTGAESAVKCYKNKRAHDAGISSLIVEKDNIENNIWIVTGSFDKCLKIWSNDGKLIHKFDGFITAITGCCYVPKSKTIWTIAGTNSAYIYDPKSGENVTDFIDTFTEQETSHEKYYLQLIKYFQEFNVLVTTTSRKQLIVYKYNPFGSLCSIKHNRNIESICYTKKAPILIFTGDDENIMKWEQTQSNQLIYSSERLIKNDNVIRESSALQTITDYKKQHANEKLNQSNSGRTILKLLFSEKLDLIIAACEDSNIYIWGFDDEAVTILKNMNSVFNEKESTNQEFFSYQNESEQDDIQVQKGYSKNSDGNEENIGEDLKPNLGDDSSVTNRVAGFKLKAVLSEHTSSVSAIAVAQFSGTEYLLSGGWDRRICIWDLNSTRFRLFDVFRNKDAKILDDIELASDGNILDICYCEKYNLFAYSSTDSMCYIRKFSLSGSEMVLINTLQGHKSEVNCIRWNNLNDTWITGGEDGMLIFWSLDGECLHALNCGGTVNGVALDPSEGSVIVAAHDTIKVYDIEYRLVQSNVGHVDAIRDIITLPERNCFMSASWDRTIKIWRAYRKPSTAQKKVELNKEKKFEAWIWNQFKKATRNEEADYIYCD